MRRGNRFLAPTLLAASAAVAAAAAVAESASSPPSPQCAFTEYRRLDFWIGDWDAYEVGGAEKSERPADEPVARCRVETMLGGCALREVYEQNDGLSGESFTVYDAARRLWHQSWVTNRGQLLTIEGTFRGDTLTLEGTLRAPGVPDRTIRGIWKPQDGGVRETAQTSSDGGATWRPYFDILFRRHREPQS